MTTPTAADLRAYRLMDAAHAYRETIPRIVHRIWVGTDEPDWSTDAETAWTRTLDYTWIVHTLRRLHPASTPRTFEIQLTHPDLPPVVLADLARCELLHTHGGIYLDADIWPLRPLDDLAGRRPSWVAEDPDPRPEWPRPWILNGALGFTPGHPLPLAVLTHALAKIRHPDLDPTRAAAGRPDVDIAGPRQWTNAYRRNAGVDVLPAETFYPIPQRARDQVAGLLVSTRTNPDVVRDVWPGTYGIHAWAASWQTTP